jgi:hypothetical protein
VRNLTGRPGQPREAKTVKALRVFVVLLALSASAGAAAPARADCPDVVECQGLTGDYGYETVGKIHVPTCYKFGKGCRPWHCDGRYGSTNRVYWEEQCNQRVPQCAIGSGCKVQFPGAIL